MIVRPGRVLLRDSVHDDRRDGALDLARAAVDALVGVDVALPVADVDAVDRADLDAGAVEVVDAVGPMT